VSHFEKKFFKIHFYCRYFSPEDGNETKDEVSLFCDFYKYSNRTMSFTQEKKRQLFLQKQKEKRSEAFDEKRDLSELFNEGDTLESMECETVNRRKKYKKVPFGYKLMGSEWLTEVPEDLADNWLVKLCPEGVRYLIVANKVRQIAKLVAQNNVKTAGYYHMLLPKW
jgi:CBS-domain-containing membrane protein